MSNETPTLGEYLHDARKESNLSLREVAAVIGVSPSYVCDIENDRRTPAEPVIKALADAVGVSFDRAMAFGNKMGEDTERYLKRHPDAVELVRRIAEMDLTSIQLQSLLKFVERKF